MENTILSVNEQNILEYGTALGLTLYICEGYIAVTSRSGNWHICLKDDNSIQYLRHENYKFGKIANLKEHKCNSSSHEQKTKSKNIFSVLAYIAKHDMLWFKRKPRYVWWGIE